MKRSSAYIFAVGDSQSESAQRCVRFAETLSHKVGDVFDMREDDVLERIEAAADTAPPLFVLADRVEDLIIKGDSIRSFVWLTQFLKVRGAVLWTVTNGGTSVTHAGWHQVVSLFAAAADWATPPSGKPSSYVGVIAAPSKSERARQTQQLRSFAAVEKIEYRRLVELKRNIEPKKDFKTLMGMLSPGDALVFPEVNMVGSGLPNAHRAWSAFIGAGFHLAAIMDRFSSWQDGAFEAWIRKATLPELPADSSIREHFLDSVRAYIRTRTITGAAKVMGIPPGSIHYQLELTLGALESFIEDGATIAGLENRFALEPNTIKMLQIWWSAKEFKRGSTTRKRKLKT